MSWKDLARAYLDPDLGDTTPCDDAEAIIEREAIASLDGGVPAAWASVLVLIEGGPAPQSVGAREWRDWLDATWRRAEQRAGEPAWRPH